MALMGIDVGSTNIKCVVMDIRGRVLSLKKTPSRLYSHLPDGRGYLDCERLFQTVSGLCGEAWRGVSGEKLDGVAIASIGSAGVLLDENGKQVIYTVFGPAADPLAETPEDKYRDICGYSKSYRCAGHFLSRYFAERPVPGGSFSLMSPGDYICFRLTGVKRREESSAGSVFLWDRKKGGRWPEFISALGLDDRILPPACKCGEYIGSVTSGAGELGLPVGTPVFAGGQDYLCAAFAAGCTGEGDMADVLGTYELLASFYDSPPKSAKAEGFATFMDRHVCPGGFTVTAEIFSAGRVERFFRETGADAGQVSRLFETLNASDCNSADYAPGTLAGEITAVNLASAKLFDYQRQITGGRGITVKAVGGGSASRFWLQNKADITGAVFIAPRIPEAAASGAALLAGVGCGAYPSHKSAARVFEGTEIAVYTPNPRNHEYYARLMETAEMKKPE